MTDPRIIPDEELARWTEHLARFHAHEGSRTFPDTCADCRTVALIEHGKALAEQLEAAMLCIKGNEMLLRDLEEKVEKAEAKITVLKDDLASMFRSHEEWRHLCEKAEAERDDANLCVDIEKARADAAVQRLADRDKAIRDLAEDLASQARQARVGLDAWLARMEDTQEPVVLFGEKPIGTPPTVPAEWTEEPS